MKMKRFHKVLVIILAVTLSISIIGGIATAAVGSSYFYDTYKNGGYSVGIGDQDMETKTVDTTITAVELSEIVYNIEVKASTTSETKVTYPTKYMSLNVNDGKLVLTGNDSFWNRNGFNWLTSWFSDSDHTTITIEVPQSLTTFSLDGNVGNTKINGLKIADFEINGGVGNVNISTIEITDSLKLDTGVGNMTLQNITGKANVDINGGVGNVDIIEMKANDITIDAGVGNIDLEKLNVNALDLRGGVGNIKVVSSTIKRLTGDKGLGDIKISSDCIIEDNRLYFD